ncbi:uncharacterized protein [Nicotiana tomentosiformis]|uniref:uncharacterized protein n=1 Tax=Nicotiana tomentosiformis TaxID=4098 RepID=UPI00388CAD66
MAPKKKARTGQRANVTPGVAVDFIFNDAGEHPRSENIPPVTMLPDSTITDQTTPIPTPTEGATVPPTDIPVPPPAPASDSVFTGSNLEEDPQDFIEEMHKTLQVMRGTEMEEVKLDSHRLKEVAYSWFELWEESREEGSPPARWGEFVDDFIDHFLPTETKAARAAEFENLRQVALNSDMNYGKMVAFAQATETRKLRNITERGGSNKARSAVNFGGSSGGSRSAFRGGSLGPSQSFAQSLASAPPSGPSQQQWSCFRPIQGNKGSYQQGRHGGRFQKQRSPPCPRCGNMHLGIYYMDLPICYGCGLRGHIQRDCSSSYQGAGRGTSQPDSSVATTSATPPLDRGNPTSVGCGAARGGA